MKHRRALSRLGLTLTLAPLIASCEPPTAAEQDLRQRLYDGQVVRVATAPDGTVLWAVRADGRNVYFASSGTQVSEFCGKGCVRPEIVPTVRP